MMNQPRQSTLFQTWSKKEVQPHSEQRSRNHGAGASGRPGTSYDGNQPQGPSNKRTDFIDLCNDDMDDEDAMLAQALEESLLYAQASSTSGPGPSTDPPFRSHDHGDAAGSTSECMVNDDRSNQNSCQNVVSVGAVATVTQPSQSLSQIDDLPGFDKAAGKIWIYPTNYPVREYQFNIVGKALFKNTLVTLPTGLGKTFIAAVLMYNFYRWYPQGKVMFMAPTKPLVAQQIEACYNIMGIPQEDTAEMTGTMVPTERLKAWNYKRVFFLTPQVLTNDLSRGACPAEEVKCLVIDEAHKALGNHAYCQVVRELVKYTREFRVLALSATPGSDIKAVQQVLANLVISHIELRTEESIDIQPYVHQRKVEKIVIPLGQELNSAKEKYIRILDVIVRRLIRQRVLYNRQTTSMSKFLILKARDAFRQNPPQELQRTQYGVVEGDFAMAMSLYHGYELLQLHGLKSLYNFLESLVTGEKGSGRTRSELMRNADFTALFEDLQGKFAEGSSSANTLPFALSQRKTPNQPFVSGHPKMEKLKEVVLEHFEKFTEPGADPGTASTRIMIFSQYRNSVNEITDLLSRHRPTVTVMSFIGQSSAGKATKGFTQKEQLMVMKKFREGGYNTLVSTCVGEEGLDIGDVDLIICFDAHKSPIRLVQRMGRTGRKRQGRIVMLVTEGKEEQIYNQSQYSKKSIHKAILNGTKSLQFYPHSPRMVPDNLKPVCHKMYISIQQEYKSVHRGKKASECGNTRKITGMLGQAGKRCQKNDGFLTETELQYWNDHFKVPQEEIPKIPESDFNYFKRKGQDRPEEIPPRQHQGPVLRLDEWLPWQNRKHDTQLIDHSLQVTHLVEMMEFIDLQQVLGPDDDAYGLEMASYLNYDDVLRAGESNNKPADGILRFCVQDNGNPLPKGEESKKSKARRTNQRSSEMLPQFDSDVAESNSDDDLPPFMVNAGDADNVSKSNPTKETGDDIEGSNVNGRGKLTDEQETVQMDLERTDLLYDVNGERKTKHKITNKSVTAEKKGKTKVRLLSKNESSNTASTEGFVEALKKLEKRKTKKKRFSSGNKTVVDIIVGDSDSDFDVPDDGGMCDKAREEQHSDVEDADGVAIEGQPWEPSHMDYSPGKTLACENDQVLLDKITTESSRLSQLLPDFTTIVKSLRSPAFLKSSCERADQRFPTPSRETSGLKYCVPSPPPIEEVEEVFASMGDKFPPIDLVQLVDEWEKEKRTTVSSKSSQELNNSSENSFKHETKNTSRTVKMSVPVNDVKVARGTSDANREGVMSSSMTTKNSRIEYEQKCVQEVSNFGFEDKVFSEAMEFEDKVTSPGDVQEPRVLTRSPSVAKSDKDKFRSPADTCNGAAEVCEMKTSPCAPSDDFVTPVLLDKSLDKYSEEKCVDRETVVLKSPTQGQLKETVSSDLFADDEEVHEDYGKWTLQIADFDEVFAATQHTPERKTSLPFQAYSSTKPGDPMIATSKADVESPEKYEEIFLEGCNILANINTSSQRSMNMHNGPARKRTMGGVGQSSEEESQFTFTQALASLQDSPAPTQNDFVRSTQPFSAPTHCARVSKRTPAADVPAMEAASVVLRAKEETNGSLSFTRPKASGDILPLETFKSVHINKGGIDKCSSITRPEATLDLPSLEKSSAWHIDVTDQINASSSLFLDSDSDESDERPQFDLGFNFDDVDVVPPSPVHKPAASQKSKCSQSMVFGKKRLSTTFNATNSDLTTQPNLYISTWETIDEHCIADAPDDIHEDSLVVSPSPAHKASVSRRSSKSSQSMVFGKKRLSTTFSEMDVSKTTLSNMNMSNYDDENFTDDCLAKALDEIAEDPEFLVTMTMDSRPFSVTLAEDPGQQNILKLKRTSLVAASSPVVSRHESEVKPVSPVLSLVASSAKDLLNAVEDPCPSSSDSEESFCVVKKKGRRVAIIDSPVISGILQTTGTGEPGRSPDIRAHDFKTPTRPKEKPARQNSSRLQLDLSNLRNAKSSSESEDDTGLLGRFRQTSSRQRAIPPLAIDDDDFQAAGRGIGRQVAALRSESSINKKNVAVSHNSKKREKGNKKKRPAGACGFIEFEAELSDDGASGLSDDEMDGSDEDVMLDSFINDATQLSQMSQSHVPFDDKAMYLRSVRSPLMARGRGRYRIHPTRPAVLDVLSQPAPQDESEYLEDSFCVDDDLEETGCLLDSDEEISVIHHSPVNNKSKRTKNVKKQQKSAESNPSNVRKRIVTMIDSSSDEETGVITTPDVSRLSTTSDDVVQASRPTKRAKILSSTDDENPLPNSDVHARLDLSQHSPPLLSLRSRLNNCTNMTGKLQETKISNQSRMESSHIHGRKTITNHSNSVLESDLTSAKNIDCGARLVDRFTSVANQSCLNATNQLAHTKLKDKSAAELREERLRRQREKQEEFKRKLAEQKQLQSPHNEGKCTKHSKVSGSSVQYSSHSDRFETSSRTVAVVYPNGRELSAPDHDHMSFTKLHERMEEEIPVSLHLGIDAELANEVSLLTSPGSSKFRNKGKVVVLVDSREITSGQEVVSCLRIKHQFNVVVRQLTGCDYILSNRLAVERKQWSDFANGANRSKLQDRIQHMCSLFDRQVLIIEKDRVKPGEEKSARPLIRTKYVDRTLALLAQSSVRLFFTDTQEGSAELLASLCRLEERKGMAVTHDLDLDPLKQQMLKFFLSIPFVSFVNALNLCYCFRNITEFTKSSVKVLQTKGQMSESRARSILEYIQHQFCATMVPASRH